MATLQNLIKRGKSPSAVNIQDPKRHIIAPMTRRSILQLFGVGAAVVPIVGGTPAMAAAATLIEVPKIEPVLTMLPPVTGTGHEAPWYEMSVFFRSETGDIYRLTANTLLRERWMRLTGYHNAIDWTLKGTIPERDLQNVPACNVRQFHPDMPVFDRDIPSNDPHYQASPQKR